MSYQIVITQITEQTRTKGPQWTKLGTKEVEREERFYNGDPGAPKTRIDEVYGYTPEVQTTETVSAKIFEQTVEVLNLNAVIKAINSL